ncbi:MAG: hypothetical protein Q9204_004200, partial [Flavoplaca sp. TL-2023a]
MHPPPFVGGRSNSVHSQYPNQSQPPPQSLLLRHLGNYAANQRTTMDGDMHRSVRERLEVEEALRQEQIPTSFEAWLASLSLGGKGKARSGKAGAGKSQNRRSVVTVLQNLSHRVGTIQPATFLQPLAQIVHVNNLNDLYVSLSAAPGPDDHPEPDNLSMTAVIMRCPWSRPSAPTVKCRPRSTSAVPLF